ncbi:MAG: hypothetical protein NDI66_03390 [Pseudomonas sp.]|nr:hypothetical protein [Pseudomonas sp.]
MAYELIAAGAGLGLGAWFVLGADASDRARIGVGALLALALALRFVVAQPLAATLLFVAVAIGVLVFRRHRGHG